MSMFILNTELNDTRIFFCLRKSDVLLKEFQFVMSLKIWQSMSAMLLYH